MNEFEKNHPQELRVFLDKLHCLIDDYHHHLYLIDDVFESLGTILRVVSDEIEDFEERNK
jgi:hypothetical protein